MVSNRMVKKDYGVHIRWNWSDGKGLTNTMQQDFHMWVTLESFLKEVEGIYIPDDHYFIFEVKEENDN